MKSASNKEMPVPWTNRARKAVALGLKVAQKCGESELSLLMLFSGLLNLPRSAARDILRHLNINLEALTSEISQHLPETNSSDSTTVKMSVLAEMTLEHAELLAERFGQDCVGTDTLLAAIMNRADREIAEVLTACQINIDSVQNTLLSHLKQSGQSHSRTTAAAESIRFEDALVQWEPEEIVARMLRFYEMQKQAAISREDFASATLYRDRIRRLKSLSDGSSP